MIDLSNYGLADVLLLTPEQCREILIQNRWPDGPICPKCGAPDAYRITRRSQSKNVLSSLFKCRDCRRQFSATVGTIFEDSKIPLNKWFAAIYLMCANKKGVSAHQIHRMLKISYEAAWFMCHRVREAMGPESGGDDEQLGGIVEADETYVGPRTRRGHPTWHEQVKDEEEMGLRQPKKRKGPFEGKTAVFGVIERGSGKVRTQVVDDTKSATLQALILERVDSGAVLMTDGHPAYRSMGRRITHRTVDHEIEYVRLDPDTGILVHTQNIENYWSIFKRGLYGIFHHLSTHRLPMYLKEFDFRSGSRRVSDGARFQALLGQVRGRRVTWYCQAPLAPNPYA